MYKTEKRAARQYIEDLHVVGESSFHEWLKEFPPLLGCIDVLAPLLPTPAD